MYYYCYSNILCNTRSQTMSLASGTVNNTEIDDLVQSSLESEHELKWIPYEDITYIKPTQVDNVYNKYYTRDDGESRIMLLCLGNSGECTQTLVSEFARIYSLPTRNYKSTVSQFRRYKRWLKNRNFRIRG